MRAWARALHSEPRMRTRWLASFLFLLVAACGGGGNGGTCAHADACGACETGFVADDVCVNGSYQCNCIALDMSGVVQDGSTPPDLSSHD